MIKGTYNSETYQDFNEWFSASGLPEEDIETAKKVWNGCLDIVTDFFFDHEGTDYEAAAKFKTDSTHPEN